MSLPSGAGKRRISNLQDLDKELIEVDKAFQISDDEGRRRLAEFEYVVTGDFGYDPYSQEYAAAQLRIYQALSGRESYSPEVNEESLFDIASATVRPFPYSTQSASTVADQLIAQGYLIRIMNLPAGASIVEFGPGWGNTTVHLARMGYRVTAVDVEKNFVDLIRSRADRLGLEIDLVNQDMAKFRPDRLFDAALFFECFHHCSDHQQLLRNLHEMISPDGILAFAAEPIIDFPYPWGFVRNDGMTLWSIRKFGWYEIGFDTSYFLRTLLLYGWLPRRYTSDVSPLANVILARKGKGFYQPSEITLPPDEARTWGESSAEQILVGNDSVLSCTLTRQVSALEYCLSNLGDRSAEVTLYGGAQHQTVTIPPRAQRVQCRVPVADWMGRIRIAKRDSMFGFRESHLALHSVRLTPSV